MRRVIAALLLFGCSEPTEDLDEGEAGTAAESSDSGEESGGTTGGDVETACAIAGQGATWCEWYTWCVRSFCAAEDIGCVGTCQVEIVRAAPRRECAVRLDGSHILEGTDPGYCEPYDDTACIPGGADVKPWYEECYGSPEYYCRPFRAPYKSLSGEPDSCSADVVECSDTDLRSYGCAVEVWAEDMGSHGVQCLQRWECLDAGGDPAVCHGLYDEACAKLGL